jgi:hypothetical protein
MNMWTEALGLQATYIYNKEGHHIAEGINMSLSMVYTAPYILTFSWQRPI